MANLSKPQDDDQAKRRNEIKEHAKYYKYNNDIGIPLVEASGPDDGNKVDWTVKVILLLIKIRANLQQICDRSGYNFMHKKPLRDIPEFVTVLRNNGAIADYFAPDLGLILGESSAKRPKYLADYVEKIFYIRGPNNNGIAAVPDIALQWDSDKTFGYTFLAGPNPTQLQRYTAERKPPDFDLDDFDLGALPEFRGDNMTRAVGEGRVYFVDHSSMRELFADLPGAPAANATPRSFQGRASDDYKYIYAPYAAFAMQIDGKNLLPIAIQCGSKAEGHQVYTPKDGYSWKMARCCVLAAHNNHHEGVSHLGTTHLLIDPIIMATRTRLSTRHPVYALLSPHFEGTVSINVGARTGLILPERSVDRLVGSKIETNYPYIVKNRLQYSFRDNFLKKRMEMRGTADSTALPNFPYRDDAYLIWDAILAFVREFVAIWYRSEAELRADYEIQAWANEIHNVGKVRDFCLTGGGVQSRDDLIDMLTMTIFTAGPQHAAVNFAQGGDMSFVPANPLSGYAPAPKGTGHTEQDLLDILPPMDVAVQTWSILSLLAGVNNTRLGNYRQSFITNPYTEAEIIKFNSKLSRVEAEINETNKYRRSLFGLEYKYLLPSRIPASINI